jgi:membrane-bound lytic murein transglycosylase B
MSSKPVRVQLSMRSVLATVLVCLVLTGRAYAQEPPPVAPVGFPPPFEAWLADVRTEALSRGIRTDIVEHALGTLQPVPQIIERDRSQAEFDLDLDTYLERRITRLTVRTADRMYARHKALLQKIAKAYGVSPRIVVAIWGLESNFGRFSGVRPTIATLVTLAYDPRRAPLFRTELFHALEILNRGDIHFDQLKGSWAGALGQPQFMPSSYLKYAQDFDGDGTRDIWRSQADVFASIAFFLQQHGWKSGQTWGREVRVPEGIREKLDALPRRSQGCRAERLLTEPMPLAEWRALGLRALSGNALPKASVEASLVAAGSRHYLIYRNYETLLEYNCAHSYALSIALLADRIR